MPEPRWQTDFRRAPLVIAYVADGDDRTAPEIGSMPAIIREVTSHPGRKAVVLDLTFGKPDAERRKIFVDEVQARWATIRESLVALAIVAPNMLLRSTVTAVLWFIKAPCPMAIFEHRRDAVLWATEELRKAGLHVPGRDSIP